MKNLQRLVEAYQKSATVEKIVGILSTKAHTSLQLSGLVGAQASFYLAATSQLIRDRHHVIVAMDKEDAAYLQNDLAAILPERSIYFFPDSFKFPTNFEQINNTNILTRSETIHQLANNHIKSNIIVTYPEALFEKVVSPAILQKTKIEISKGEELDIDFVIEMLVEHGFQRTDFVYEPGQFSIRGGIVDIFSFGNEFPYRIELFDEEVEQIKIFDPVTQLSKRNIANVSLVPNLKSQFAAEDKVSLLSIIADQAVVWMRDAQFFIDRLQICFEKLAEFAKQIQWSEPETYASFYQDRAFVYPHEITDDIAKLSIIHLNNHQSVKAQQVLTVQSKAQPTFNKNFTLLIEHLQKQEKAGIETFLFTANNKQVERFYRIFEDLEAHVHFHPVVASLHAGFIDMDHKLACLTDHQIFERYHRYSIRKGFSKDQALKIRMLRELQPGDFVTHIDYGVGRYSGLEKLEINGRTQESVRLIYKNNDVLYVSINALHKISKYVGKDGTPPRLSRIGGDAWKNVKRKTKRKIKDIAKELIKLYAQRKASKGYAFSPDSYLQNELEASFIYEDTPDQYQATLDVKEDMQKEYPMDRLICGDVGFGKTEVAIRAAFKCVADGKQVAVLVPTTILALQHYKTFSDRLKEFNLTIDYVNRFRSTKEKREIFEKAKSGKIEILIGTHSLLNKELSFKDLGLLIIDEEQKFGVAAKEKLRNLKVNVDTLILTATPIPRTLQFSLMSARDLSIIRTPPPNRQPIHTERRVFNDDLIREAIYYEVDRGGQVFFVHNRVKNLMDMVVMLRKLCPDLKIVPAHGQMDPKELEKALLDFINGNTDVLVCTNIIETGLDIPNANTMIINNAHQFGLSDLHQLRGRVGRSNRKAFCYLFCPPLSVLTPEARKRIRTLEEFSDLGSGFHIAMKDLDIRGAGNLLGAEQSGFIADIGYETYQKILDEAIQELKESEFKDLFKREIEEKQQFVRDVHIETDTEMHIPDDYVASIEERLRLYTQLDDIESEEGIETFNEMLLDRFGPVPEPVEELYNGLKLRWICKAMGFERVSLKQDRLRCFFTRNQQSPFYETDFFKAFLSYISKYSIEDKIAIKQTQHFLIVIKPGIQSLRHAYEFLHELKEKVDAQQLLVGKEN